MSACLCVCVRALACLELIESHWKDRMTQQREGKSAHPWNTQRSARTTRKHWERIWPNAKQLFCLSSLPAVLLFLLMVVAGGGRWWLGRQVKTINGIEAL